MSDRLDDILSSDTPTKPSADFCANVMRAVREEALVDEPIRFPWWRLAAGVAAMLAIALLQAGIPIARESMSAGLFVAVVRFWDSAIVSSGLLWVIAGGFLSSITIRLTLRATAAS